MKKLQKIRRYGNIYGYGARSHSPLIVIAMVAGLLFFALVGWSIYPPIRDYLLADGQQVTGEPSSEPDSPSSQSPAASSEPAAGSSQPSAPQQQAVDMLSGLYVPPDIARDPALLSGLLQSAKDVGMNTVWVDAKDATGIVLYDSRNALAGEIRAVAEHPFDAREFVRQVTEAGLTPAARLYAFSDHLAAAAKRAPMAVQYYDTGILWLDNSQDLNGRAWLNPYSAEATKYIGDLAVELTEAGFTDIVIEAMQFPSGVGQDKAGYGPIPASTPRAAALQTAISTVRDRVGEVGGRVLFGISHLSLTGGENDVAARQRNLQFYGEEIPGALVSGSCLLTLPQDPSGDDALLSNAQAWSTAYGTEWTILIPAYGSDGSALTAPQLQGRIEKFCADGKMGSLLYNPQASYLLQ